MTPDDGLDENNEEEEANNSSHFGRGYTVTYASDRHIFAVFHPLSVYY